MPVICWMVIVDFKVLNRLFVQSETFDLTGNSVNYFGSKDGLPVVAEIQGGHKKLTNLAFVRHFRRNAERIFRIIDGYSQSPSAKKRPRGCGFKAPPQLTAGLCAPCNLRKYG